MKRIEHPLVVKYRKLLARSSFLLANGGRMSHPQRTKEELARLTVEIEAARRAMVRSPEAREWLAKEWKRTERKLARRER